MFSGALDRDDQLPALEVMQERLKNAKRREELLRIDRAMLGATVHTKRSPESDDLSLQVSLVAGGGFEPPTFGL